LRATAVDWNRHVRGETEAYYRMATSLRICASSTSTRLRSLSLLSVLHASPDSFLMSHMRKLSGLLPGLSPLSLLLSRSFLPFLLPLSLALSSPPSSLLALAVPHTGQGKKRARVMARKWRCGTLMHTNGAVDHTPAGCPSTCASTPSCAPTQRHQPRTHTRTHRETRACTTRSTLGAGHAVRGC
jgi:hypothetical protein